MFAGWPPEALSFFEGLEADNSKGYWQANKATYQEAVLGPMQALLADLAPEWGDAKVMRPNRDIRFSADKSPYKTFIAGMVGSGFVRLSADGLGAGGGMWEPAPDQLARYRAAVADDAAGSELVSLAAAAQAAGLQVMSHESLKSAPKGYPADHPRIEFLRYKGLASWQEWPAGPWLATPEPLDKVRGFLRAAAPVNDWLARHVGPSTQERVRP